MREKYQIIGLHESETAGVKKHFDGKANNEVLGKKDGHGFITVSFLFPIVLMLGFDYLVLLRCLCSLPRKERNRRIGQQRSRLSHPQGVLSESLVALSFRQEGRSL